MTTTTSSFLRKAGIQAGGALVLSVLVFAETASAQQWPARPVRVVVPFTAGSATDLIARMYAEKLAQQVGTNFVVENRPGAGGTIGMTIASKAEPDGQTVLIHSSSYTISQWTYSNLGFDTARDFAGVTPLANIPNILVIAPSKGVRSVKELVAAAKAKPGHLTYASAGAGTATQLNAERFRLGAGFEGVHVPFKGTPEALADVMTGRVDIYFCPVINALELVKAGKLLALAAGSSKRSSALPDLPTTVEAGIPNSDYNFWVGMAVPSKVRREIVDRLHQSTMKALQLADTKERMAKLGADPMPMTPKEFDAYIKKELAANAALVKAAGIQVN